MRRFSLALALVVVVSAAIGLYLYLRRPVAKPETAAANTPATRPQRSGATVNATGTIRLRVGSEVRVGSQLSGSVKKLYVTVGSHVQQGSVIAEIDDRSTRARLAGAEAQAGLDQATVERARVNYDRARKLAAQGLVPAQQEQDLQLALKEAEARYEKSLRDRDLVKVDLEYVQILAPITGTVASVSTQEGETVAASFAAPTFVTIIGEHALELVAMVDETDIASVRVGNPAVFTVDSYPARDFAGVVVRIAPKATIISGVVNYEVSIQIVEDMSLLKPDMTANVSIQTTQVRTSPGAGQAPNKR
jgi:RND family efflux transporter MFP subunit